MNLHFSALMVDLDRGDGVCIHLNIITRECNIYQDRPDKCRVNDYYLKYYQQKYSWEEFIELNLIICNQLVDRNILF